MAFLHLCRFDQIKTLVGERIDPEIVLVGNKKDLEDSRVVTSEQATQLAAQLGCSYIETSAKELESVEECFKMLASVIINKS